MQSSETPIQSVKKAVQAGQFESALALIEQLMQKNPNTTTANDARYLRAVACRQLGRLEEGIASARELIQHDDGFARAHQELGYLYSQQQRTAQAAAAFYQATQRNPSLVGSWKALVSLYQQLNNPVASDFAQQQVDYLSSLPREILGARDLMYEGQLKLADQVCRQFLQTHKHHVEAMLLLAELGIQLKLYTETEFLLESSVELHPEHQATVREYLKLLTKLGKFDKAKAVADSALTQFPTDSTLRLGKASALVGLGELDAAIEIYQDALQANPQQPNVHLLLGHALKAKGLLDDAVSAYQQAYASKPDFGDAFWSLANTKTYRFSEAESEKMNALVEDPRVDIEDKIHVHFALGKCFEDRQQYQQSFSHYANGNRLKQSQLQYQADYIDRQVDAQIKHMTADVFAQHAGAGCNAPDPIFIVGLPRAGSTLLEQILASHSAVDGTMELHNILGLVSRLRGHKLAYPELLGQLQPDYLARFGQQYIDETKVYRGGAPYFIDKMPNNFIHIGLIKLILPNAKIIDARRDAMDCCFSGFKQLFGEGQEFTYDLHNIGRYYTAYQRLMEHWDKVLPGAVLRVQHEDVIDDLETQVNRILDYCDLPFEQSCLDFYKTKRVIKTPSSEQVRQPINRSGMGKWKHFQDYLTPLYQALKQHA